MNIDGFKATIKANDLLDSSRYTVQILGPIGGLTMDEQTLCSSCSIPGRGFSTVEKYTHGPIRKVPYAELYDDITTTFYMPTKMGIHDFFNQWQILIGGESYYIGYYDDIIGSVIIVIEDKKGNDVAIYELYEAYPISISPIELAYDRGEQISEFTVTWAYHHYEKKLLPARIEPTAPQGDGTLDRAIEIAEELGRNAIRGGFDTPLGAVRVAERITGIDIRPPVPLNWRR